MDKKTGIMEFEPLVHDRYSQEEFSLIGKRGISRMCGKEKAGGSAEYTRDVKLPGMLYCRILGSPYAHAKILKMDTSKAEKLPGVRGILRFDDPELEGKSLMGLESKFNAGHLATDGIDFYHGKEQLATTLPFWQTGGGRILDGVAWWEGHPVGAAIAADTAEIAEEALSLLEIEWEELPVVLDVYEALKPGAPLAIPEINSKNNLIQKLKIHRGDVEEGLKEADKIIDFKIRRRPYTAAEPEPISNVVVWKGDNVEIWAHQQQAYDSKIILAGKWGIPMNRIKLHVPYQGAGYGAGGNPMMHHTHGIHNIGMILAKRIGRPVKTLYDRRDTFYNLSQDADSHTSFKVGFKNDGTITAVKMDNIVAKMGQYGTDHLVENTSIKHILLNYIEAQLNIAPAWWFRCEQNHNALCLSAIFEHVADALEMDPTEVALKNDGSEGKDMEYLSEFKKSHGFPDRDSLKELIDIGAEKIDWYNKKHKPGAKKLENGNYHGIGFTWTQEWDDGRGTAAAALMVHGDGSVDIISQKSDVGVNAMTTHCQIVAEEMGLKLEHVNFRFFEDAGLQMMTPDGSCNLCVDGFVTRNCAREAKQKIKEYAVTPVHTIEIDYEPAFPGWCPEDIEVEDSMVFVKNDPSHKVSVGEVVKRSMHDQGGTQAPIYVWNYHRQGRYGEEEGRHRLTRQGYFAEVEVDPGTGGVIIKKIVNLNDVGKVISPETVEGQQYGGAYMGAGRCLAEEVIYDPKTGVKLNDNYIDYKVFTLRDILEQENIALETDMGYGPYGLVGVGECIATVIPGVLANAIYNAIGEWVDDHPITPDKILDAVSKAKERGVLK